MYVYLKHPSENVHKRLLAKEIFFITLQILKFGISAQSAREQTEIEFPLKTDPFLKQAHANESTFPFTIQLLSCYLDVSCSSFKQQNK